MSIPHHRIFRTLAAAMALVMCMATASGQSNEDLLWLTWEHRRVDPQLCNNRAYCRPISTYATRLFKRSSPVEARELISQMDMLAASREFSATDLRTPQICQSIDAMQVLGFDPETLPLSAKQEALRNLPGVYFDVRRLKSPADFDGPFGEVLQKEIARKLRHAGIRVLSREEHLLAPGQPRLNIYFSNTNPVTGCRFSIYASLSQTVLLSRNHIIKFKAGTWGASGGYSLDAPTRREYDAILHVVDVFIRDYWKANAATPSAQASKG